MSNSEDIDNSGKESGKHFSDHVLHAYLEGQLSQEDIRKIEESFGSDSPEAEAIEGLRLLGTNDRYLMQAKLQQDLKKLLRNQVRKRKGMMSQRWIILTVVLLLLLIVLGYFVIKIRLQSV